MKIEVQKIQLEGLILEEAIPASKLDLDTDIITFKEPLVVQAKVSKITDTVTINAALQTSGFAYCSRCLEEFTINFSKKVQLIYRVRRPDEAIELDPEFREEIILDYPMKPLCKPDCRGLCPQCGKNLNEGECVH